MRKLTNCSLHPWLALVAVPLLAAGAAAQAKPATVALYKAQCAACHSEDGSATAPAGKALGAHDFRSAAVQSQTDAELTATITNGKNKMPAYGKKLKPAEIAALVGYLRELGKK